MAAQVRALPLALPLVALLGGCWLGQNSSATAEYSRQVSISSIRVAQLEESLTEAEARVAQLEEFVRLQGENSVEQIDTMAEVTQELSRIRGQLEELRFGLDQLTEERKEAWLQQERRQLYDELRLGNLERSMGVPPPPPPTDADLGIDSGTPSEGGADTEPGTSGTDEVPADVIGKLDLAVSHMMAGRNAVARVLLERAVVDHPDAPELAEVRYRIAETLYNEARWGQAARAFEVVLSNHPDSDWAAWSMLRQGESFESMNQPDNARFFYEDLVSKYPKSEAAKEAKAKLKK